MEKLGKPLKGHKTKLTGRELKKPLRERDINVLKGKCKKLERRKRMLQEVKILKMLKGRKKRRREVNKWRRKVAPQDHRTNIYDECYWCNFSSCRY